MKNLEMLKAELTGREMSFTELDNRMMNSGYYSVFDDGATLDIKHDLSVVYTSIESNEAEVIINFEITIDNSKDEAEEAFYLKVVNVDTM